MTEKCTKFKSLYLFRDEAEFEAHLKECPDCRVEKEKMDKVSELLNEVKPYYAQQRKRSFTRLKVACVLFLGLFAGMIIGYFTQLEHLSVSTAYNYSESSTDTTNEYGMPIDSYGLISLN